MNFGELIAKGGALFARKGADALADTLEAAPAADLARIQASVSGGPLQALKDSLASAERNQLPLNATRAWTAGEVVTIGAARQNAGYRYVAKNNGTCGATAPTHTNAVGVSDGAVTWCFAGAPKQAAGAEVPTVQIVSASSQSQLKQLIRGAALLAKVRFVGGTATVVSSGNWLVGPCVSTAPASGNTNTIGVTNKVASQPGWGIEFFTDAPQIMLGDGTTPFYATVPTQAYVNDRAIHDGVMSAPALVNPGALMLTFPGGSSVRKVRYLLNANDFIGGVRIPAGYSIWPSASETITVGGDSLTAGASSFPLEIGTSWPMQVGRAIGISDMRITALGGTGFLSNNGNQNSTSIQRIADVTSVSNQILHIVAGNHNDDTFTSAERKAAVKQYVALFRTAFPAVPLFMFGPDAERTAPSAALIAADADMAAAVAEIKAAGDRLIYWYSIINDPAGCWFTSANADIYSASSLGLHPNQLGIDARAQRYLSVLKRFIVSPSLF